MKIAFCIYSLRSGGAERVMTILANSLSISGHEVYLITIGAANCGYVLEPKIKLIELNLSKESKNIFGVFKNIFLRIRGLVSAFYSIRPEICISFMTENNMLALIAGEFTRVPIVISERTNPYVQTLDGIYKILRKLLYKRARALVVQTMKARVYYEENLGLKHIPVIPNPIILKDFSLNDSPQPREKMIYNIGRLSEEKGHDYLIEAFAQSEAIRLGWTLNIIGEGVLRSKLESKINQLGLTNHVFLLGRELDVMKYLSHAGMYILSSKFEGFPNALMEALASGTPCISTDCETGPSEIIKNGENGILVKNGDVNEMSQAINIMIGNKYLRDVFSKSGPITMKQFDHSVIIQKWVNLIYKVI